MSESVGFAAAFLAGVVSFLSPCVLPLIPGYLSFMTGLSARQLSAEDRPTSRILTQSLLFVAGFSFVFVALGASASALGQILTEHRILIERIAGVVVFAFGLLMTGVIKLPWLYGESRLDMERSRSFGQGASFVMGMAFGAGWTPCVGPILGSILLLAGSSESVATGAGLLLAYSLGLGLPFVLTALLFGRVRPLIQWLNRHALVINRVAGVLLMALGILMFTGQLGRFTGMLTEVLPFPEV